MKIKLLSDLHTEFWRDIAVHPGEGEVLILAGDILTADDVEKKEAGKLMREFLELCNAGYDKVFYVMGNHEFYHGHLQRSVKKIQEYLPSKFTLLNNSSEHYNGVHFVGGTMWTDFNNRSPITMWDAQQCMNDYQTIRTGSQFRRLRAEDTLAESDNTVEWFQQCVPTLRGPVVMITHHAPSIISTLEYRNDELNGAYYRNMESFIENHENIKVWCHGHTHANNDYNVHQCRVLSNPYGYDSVAPNYNFSPGFQFEVE